MKNYTLGPKRKLPQYPGDKNPSTWVRTIYPSNGIPAYEVANALAKEGHHVIHPVTHPNGSGGTPALLVLP